MSTLLLLLPPPPTWIFRPLYGPVMHLGVEYGNQTENRQKFAVFHPYVSFCIQEWMVFARKMTKALSMSNYPDFISLFILESWIKSGFFFTSLLQFYSDYTFILSE